MNSNYLNKKNKHFLMSLEYMSLILSKNSPSDQFSNKIKIDRHLKSHYRSSGPKLLFLLIRIHIYIDCYR